MEKLPLYTQKNGGKAAGIVIGRLKKISSLAVVATKIFFATAQQKSFLINLIQDDLS